MKKEHISFVKKFTSEENKRMKYLLIGMVSLFLLSTATAYWIATYSATTEMFVTGTSEITFSDNLTISNINDTSQAFSKIEILTINNNDGLRNLMVTINETIDDEIDSCSNSGDFNFGLTFEGNPVNTNDNITISSGINTLKATSSLVQYACPQNISVEVTLQ